MTLSAGTKLGPYEIVAPIGAGGMGEVYKAKDTRLGREVAIKVLPAGLWADPDRLRRFEQEARAAGLLNHPNITTVYDVGEHQDAPYVVQELLEGETLRSALARGSLSPREAIDYAVQIARGLFAAHQKGIVHRDLKPENLFVTADGRVKILDFGLAKLVQPEPPSSPQTEIPTESPATEPGVVLGTAGYMSPEQLRGKPADVRSDIFAFGAVLYEMLSGRRAFTGESAADAMLSVLKEDPLDRPITKSNISPDLERVVRRCLEKSPEQRFQSARDLGFELEELAATSQARRSGGGPGLARRPGFRLAVAGLALVLVLAVLATNTGLRRWISASLGAGRISSVAVLPLRNVSGEPSQDYFADGMTEALTADLAQIAALKVISGTSAMQYKGTKKPLRQIAQELGVDAVLEGSVARVGNRVRVTSELINASSDTHIWAKTFERDLQDVLALQAEVAREVARQVEVELTAAERARLTQEAPDRAESVRSLSARPFLSRPRDGGRPEEGAGPVHPGARNRQELCGPLRGDCQLLRGPSLLQRAFPGRGLPEGARRGQEICRARPEPRGGPRFPCLHSRILRMGLDDGGTGISARAPAETEPCRRPFLLQPVPRGRRTSGRGLRRDSARPGSGSPLPFPQGEQRSALLFPRPIR